MPPTVTCERPPSSNRAVTASITWLPTVRPNRVIHAWGIGSVFTMVPVAVPSASSAPNGRESVRVSVSLPSSCASFNTGTETVFRVSPGAKRTAPDTAS